MKSEIKTQYLTLQLKITQMLNILQENEGTINDLKKQILNLNIVQNSLWQNGNYFIFHKSHQKRLLNK